jgi:hypothetical protein
LGGPHNQYLYAKISSCNFLLLHRMYPQPDYGYDSYRGSGKLVGKVGTCVDCKPGCSVHGSVDRARSIEWCI